MQKKKFVRLATDRVDAVARPATGRSYLIVDEIESAEPDEQVEREEFDVQEIIRAEVVRTIKSLLRAKKKKAMKAMDQEVHDPEQDMEEEEMDPEEMMPGAEDAMVEVDPDDPRKKRRSRSRAASILASAFPVGSVKKVWFSDPQLSGPTPLTVTDEGRVFGHIAQWGTCHIGIKNDCVQPPRSRSDYRFFRTGAMDVDGEQIPVGQITLGTGHADLRADATMAAAHYDNTGSSVADVVAGEDQWGPWVSGALRKGVSIEQVHALRASAPSGDWRTIAGSLELVGVLAVNVPGYPVPRTIAASAFGYDEDGNISSVIATGKQGSDPELVGEVAALRSEMASMKNTMNKVRPFIVEQIRRSIGVDSKKANSPHARLATLKVALAEGGKTESGKVFPKSDWAYTPSDKPSEWKLRLTSTPGGKPDPKIVGAAVAALGKGFRGNKVEIPSTDLAKVKARVASAWKKANPDKGEDEIPDVLK